MKILRLLNKNNLLLILAFVSLPILNGESEEAIDIWKLDPKEMTVKNSPLENNEEDISIKNSIYESQTKKINKLDIEEDFEIVSKDIEIIGLYDPSENDLHIDMWSKSDGNKILDIYNKIDKINI